MNCKLTKNIKASCAYNPGGISEIHLLDIRDFIAYRFTEDHLYERPFADAIFRDKDSEFISIESVQESSFSETKKDDTYEQQLTTFVHTLEAKKLERLLLAAVNRYIVVFKTMQGTWFTFGSAAGASLEFGQISGQVGETNGYSLTLSADSIYPLFEAAGDILDFKYNIVYVPVFDDCEEAVFEPDFDYYKCEQEQVLSFVADKSSLSYPVSNNGFHITDLVQITSHDTGRYLSYQVVSQPSWLTTTQGSPNGINSPLHITVERMTADDPRSGSIELLQLETGKILSIPVIQKGRLEEGIPTEYPYVSEEKIVDEYSEKVAQIGEQIWMRENMSYWINNAQQITQAQFDAYMNYYAHNSVNRGIISRESYNEFFNGGVMWGGAFAPGIINYIDTQNSSDIHRHLVPSSDDIRELMGFLLSHVWNGEEAVGDNLAKKTIGKLTVKPSLNLQTNGYDSVRKTYPSHWVRDNLLKGTDDYALGIAGSGSFHRSSEQTAEGEGRRLFISAIFLLRNVSWNPPSSVHIWAYRDSDRGGDKTIPNPDLSLMPNGIGHHEENTGFHCKAVRTIRYRKLGYDIYSNDSEIRKIRNGTAVPAGFAVVPKGALRGAWFANPEYTYEQLAQINEYVNRVANAYSFVIG